MMLASLISTSKQNKRKYKYHKNSVWNLYANLRSHSKERDGKISMTIASCKRAGQTTEVPFTPGNADNLGIKGRHYQPQSPGHQVLSVTQTAIWPASTGDNSHMMTSWCRHTYMSYWPFVWGIHRLPMDSPHKRPVIWLFDVLFHC